MKRKTKLLIRDAFFSTILSCLILAILSLAFVNIRFFNPLHKALKDFSFLDVYYAEKFEQKTEVNNNIVLINIENHGRDVIADVLNAVLKADPKVVGFDVILEKHDTHNAADTLLRDLLNHKKVVTSFEYSENKILKNESFFGSKKRPAFVNFEFNHDEGIVRNFVGKKEINGINELSFASKISKQYLKPKTWEKRGYDELLSDTQIINYIGNTEKFIVLTFEDLIIGNAKKVLKDKIVILGYVGDSNYNSKYDIQDKFWTPLNKRIAGKSDKDMFGPVIHANIVNTIVENDFIHKVSNFWLGLITFIAMFLSTMVYMKLNKTYKISYRMRKQIYQLVVSILLLVLVFWLLKHNIMLSPFLIIVGIVLAGGYFKYYKHLTRYINTKRKWKTYLK